MRYSATVAGGLHANYGGSLSGIDANLIDRGTRRAAQGLDGKGQYATRKLLDTLIGVAPGANAQYTTPEIAASPELGGARPVNQVNLVNRATTAQDVTDLKTAITTLSVNTSNPSPVANLDRNPLGTR
jgi:hypothetical protein